MNAFQFIFNRSCLEQMKFVQYSLKPISCFIKQVVMGAWGVSSMLSLALFMVPMTVKPRPGEASTADPLSCCINGSPLSGYF